MVQTRLKRTLTCHQHLNQLVQKLPTAFASLHLSQERNQRHNFLAKNDKQDKQYNPVTHKLLKKSRPRPYASQETWALPQGKKTVNITSSQSLSPFYVFPPRLYSYKMRRNSALQQTLPLIFFKLSGWQNQWTERSGVRKQSLEKLCCLCIIIICIIHTCSLHTNPKLSVFWRDASGYTVCREALAVKQRLAAGTTNADNASVVTAEDARR